MASSPPSQEEPKPSPLEPETFLSRDTVFILIPCLKYVGSLQMNGGRSSSWRFKGFSTKKKQMQEPFLRSEDKYHWWRRMAGRGRQRPSSPIIRTKADEAEMSRWDEQGVKKPFFATRSWQGDPNIPARDERRQARTASELALMQQEAERVGSSREKKLKRIRPFFKNPFHSLRK